MSCLDTTTIADHLVGRNALATALRIDAHLGACDACMEKAVRLKNARLAMRAIEEASPPELAAMGSSARAEATLRWLRVEPLPERPWWVAGFAVAAPALCVLLIVGWARLGRHGPFREARVSEPAIAAVQAPPEAVIVAPPDPLGAIATLVGGDVKVMPARRAADTGSEASEAVGGSRAEPAAVEPVAFDSSVPVSAHDRFLIGHGARLAFQWGEGSGALLDGDSQLDVDRIEPRAQQLRIGRGSVAIRVGPHQPGESMRVVSPDHTVTAHGTWFRVSVDGRGTLVEVVEGVVEIAAPGSDERPTLLPAPSRAYFQRGHSRGEKERAIGGKEAESFRLATEMGLVPWQGGQQVLDLTGLLRVTSNPSAAMVVDGVGFGKTPLELRRPLGRHLLELSQPGFDVSQEWVFVGREPAEMTISLLRQRSEKPIARVEPIAVIEPTESDVKAVAAARSRQVRACYEHALKRDPSLAGSITLRLAVGAAGEVVTATPQVDTLYDDAVLDCLRREVSGWVFHAARNATVVYPFVFRAP